MSTFEKIQAMISEQLDMELTSITEDTNLLEDLDADSLDLFQIINDIEDEFGVTIDEDETSIVTVRDLVNYVDSQK
ncbi:MAG: acyl carrier protein [Aerococcus sp.]|nr:acyl carrier protein [Aerococcus sp.]